MFRRSLVLILLLLSGVMYAQSAPVILGVLEDVPGIYVGDSNSRAVRAVFRKRDGRWQALSTDCGDTECTAMYQESTTWTVTFDGGNLGKITSTARQDALPHPEPGLQAITGRESIPTVGTRSRDYRGFLSKPVFRPLIANSKPYFSDPDGWKPTQVREREIPLLGMAFRKKFPKLCRETKSKSGPLEAFEYKDNDVSVQRAYSSKAGWLAARLHVEAIDCSDAEAGFDIDDPWFVVSPDNSASYLDSGMWLVDAGDYDNDGKSELVFSIDR